MKLISQYFLIHLILYDHFDVLLAKNHNIRTDLELITLPQKSKFIKGRV